MPAQRKRPRVLPFQPYPLQTVLATGMGIHGPATMVIRRWEPGHVRHCQLCPKQFCTAQTGDDGQAICTVRVVGEVDDLGAPLLRIVDLGGGRLGRAGMGREQVPQMGCD